MSDVHETAPHFLPRVPVPTDYEVESRRWPAEGERQFGEAQANRFNIRLNTASLPPVQRVPEKRSEDEPGSSHSSPSIYPASLPHVDSGEESVPTIAQVVKPFEFRRVPSTRFEVKQPVDTPQRPHSAVANRDNRQRASTIGPPQRPRSAGAPPVPAKSALRSLILQPGQPHYSSVYPSSPSTASVSTTTTGTNSTILGPQVTFGRRTMLNVREIY